MVIGIIGIGRRPLIDKLKALGAALFSKLKRGKSEKKPREPKVKEKTPKLKGKRKMLKGKDESEAPKDKPEELPNARKSGHEGRSLLKVPRVVHIDFPRS